MGSLAKLFTNLTITKQLIRPSFLGAALGVNQQIIRTFDFVGKPKIGVGRAYRRKVHFPKDRTQYTVQPLDNSHLAGRDPRTGRKIVQGLGGGVKHKYHWVKWNRDGPSGEGEVQIEKVIEILKCGCRTANVALVGVGDELMYILATEHMKAGDLIKTSRYIPRIPVRANEGDAYPLGALPVGTLVHCVESNPGSNYHFIHAAGNYGTILRKFDNRVVVQLPTKKEFGFMQTCMATVGRLSNIDHGRTHIGSPQKLRELGYRPRSGLWHRKTGRHGRKIKKLPPMRLMNPVAKPNVKVVKFTLKSP